MERLIPIDLLRTLLVLIETQSFSRTGEEIGRSQSAVSLQMQRLQDIVGSPIVINSGKSVLLTPQGEILHEYAKRIVALNDECVGRLRGDALTGTIRIGIPSDFALSYLSRILGRFGEANSNVTFAVNCELSGDLIHMFDRRLFDVVLAVYDGRPTTHLTDLWREPVVWVSSRTHDLRNKRPLPLVLFPDGCQYRMRVLNALRRQQVPFRIVYSSSNLAGNQAAIESGLGLTAISKSTVPPALRPLPRCKELPRLDDVDIGLFWNPHGATMAIQELAGFLGRILDSKLKRVPISER
ncbi:MAG: LysR substrate-binding domain-containing protein [Proteobacteria bacterium]|nr:LysR substrate-binding domain-containing protein [Pseudomonadota bacterium]